MTGNESSFWSYAKSRNCSGGVTTLDDAVLSNRAMHNHPVDTAEIKTHKIGSQRSSPGMKRSSNVVGTLQLKPHNTKRNFYIHALELRPHNTKRSFYTHDAQVIS